MSNKKVLIYISMITFWLAASISLSAYGLEEYITLDFMDESRNITQSELAIILVNSMGLEAEMPTAPLISNYIKVLDDNGIRPLSSWVPKKIVTNGDFAVILARAMGLETRLIPPLQVAEENRIYIQRMWEVQYRQDGYHKSLEWLLQDKRFFPGGPPVCPFGRKYTDKNGDYIPDPIVIAPNEMELHPAVKYIYTLKRRGVMLEDHPAKILTLRTVKAALRSPIFRGAPLSVYLHGLAAAAEAEAAVTPITPGGP